ncbi:scavenger receptor class F member 2-like [Haliotis asinina]|uniref:scavenger receptor class F member 2-like n=1 Tax=Haliotis asinina TaxID=109174 RepID=UPI0035318E3D
MERYLCLLSLFLGSFAYILPLMSHCAQTCDTCQWGWYGPNCTLACTNCQNDECNQTTGVCGNCKHGHHGRGCTETCSPHCGGSGACNRQTGHCDDSCDKSFWGDKCERKCSQKCNDSVCIQESGKCHRGCHDGWTGPKCNVTCETCCVNSPCAQITKDCTECKNRNSIPVKMENGTLHKSETNKPAAGAVSGGVFVAIFIVSLVVGIIVYRRRHRQNRGDSESQDPEASPLPQADDTSPQTDAKQESDKLPVEDASGSYNI